MDASVPMRRLLEESVFATVSSPAFLMPPPIIWHANRIPQAARSAMQATWDHLWFPERTIKISVVEDVYVAAEGLVLSSTGAVFEETIKQHPPVDVLAAHTAVKAALSSRTPRLSGTVLLCRKPGATNYGHWLIEMLPTVWLTAQRWPDPLGFMVQDVEEPLRSVMGETLSFLGISRDYCHRYGPAPVWVERLLIVDGMTEHGRYMSPLVFECLDQIASRIPPHGPDRLFVDREPALSRRFENEAQVWQNAAKLRLQRFAPSCAGVRGQVAAFGSASRILGAAEAAMANLAFSRPECRAVTLTPATMPDTFFWFIGGLRGLDMWDVRWRQEGPVTGHMAWDTNIHLDNDDLASILHEFDRTDRTPPPKAEALNACLAAQFDRPYYLARYPDVAAAGFDPLGHYMEHGWREHRDPSPKFNTRRYLDRHQIAGAAPLNPLIHFVLAATGLQPSLDQDLPPARGIPTKIV